MAIVRVNSADIDHAQLLEEIRNIPPATEEQIDAWAAEDGDAWTDEDFARARVVYPPPKPAATLLQVIAAEPEAVARALESYRARWHCASEPKAAE